MGNNEVLKFINTFKYGYEKELEELFTHRDCYYFAIILQHRFPTSEIMYHIDHQHFSVLINGDLYDITGLIEDQSYLDDMVYFKMLQNSDPDEYDSIMYNIVGLK